MLTHDILAAFAKADTRTIGDALIGSQLLGTDAGDRVLAEVGNDPDALGALVAYLKRKNAWEAAA